MIMTQSSLILDTSSASCLFFVKGVIVTVGDRNFHINLKINLLIPTELFVMTSVAITWIININLGKLTFLLFWVLLSMEVVCLICFFRPLVSSPCPISFSYLTGYYGDVNDKCLSLSWEFEFLVLNWWYWLGSLRMFGLAEGSIILGLESLKTYTICSLLSQIQAFDPRCGLSPQLPASVAMLAVYGCVSAIADSAFWNRKPKEALSSISCLGVLSQQ